MKAKINQIGFDKIIVAFNIIKGTKVREQLTAELLGFENREFHHNQAKYNPRSKSKNARNPYDKGFTYFNNPKPESKTLVIQYGKKWGVSSFNYDGQFQLVSTRFQQWTKSEILSIIHKLGGILRFNFGSLRGVEFYIDYNSKPKLKGWDIAFAKKRARKSNTNPVGYSEGRIRSGRGVKGKTYKKKNENGTVQRNEVQLGRHRLKDAYDCSSFEDVLSLRPETVVTNECWYVAFRKTDWVRLNPKKPNRCKRLRRVFLTEGSVKAKTEMNQRERRIFNKRKVNVPIKKLTEGGDHE